MGMEEETRVEKTFIHVTGCPASLMKPPSKKDILHTPTQCHFTLKVIKDLTKIILHASI